MTCLTILWKCTDTHPSTPGRKVRELLGASAPDFRRVPKGRVAEQWIGAWLALWTGQLPRRHGKHERPEPARPEWERHEGATPAYAAELAAWNAEHRELLDTAPLIFHTPLEEIYVQALAAPDSLPGA